MELASGRAWLAVSEMKSIPRPSLSAQSSAVRAGGGAASSSTASSSLSPFSSQAEPSPPSGAGAAAAAAAAAFFPFPVAFPPRGMFAPLSPRGFRLLGPAEAAATGAASLTRAPAPKASRRRRVRSTSFSPLTPPYDSQAAARARPPGTSSVPVSAS